MPNVSVNNILINALRIPVESGFLDYFLYFSSLSIVTAWDWRQKTKCAGLGELKSSPPLDLSLFTDVVPFGH